MKNLSDLLPNLLLIPAACISLPALAVDSNELPTNGVIGAGTGSISQSSRELQVNQSSNTLIVNWGSFNIGADAHVNFTQPSSNSVALNRVVGTDASQIFGSLTANGKLFLINPNGVLFGRDARVDVGGLVASTLNLSDTDFLAGRYTFNADGAAGTVKNEGSIHAADNGYVALLGRHVINDGVIVARLGTVALAAGDRIALDVGGDGLINLAVDRATVDAYAANRNLIQADGGRVVMSAKAADDVAGTVVNNEGIIQARSLTQRNGVILLEGGDAGIVSVSGTLDVSGQAAGQSGGSVTVLGQKVGLFDAAHIEASGNAGGGVVLIGGNYHGTGPEPNATRTYIGADATINADALVSGDGGRVIVWSDDTTRFAGHISARGGALQGNGGFVEVSGKQDLLFTGLADLRAVNGSAGTLLLDPADITIAVGGLDSVLPNSGFANNPLGSVTLAPVNVLAELLLANLTLQASNDITVNSPVNALSLLSNNTLSLEAGRSIAINADISLLGGFNATVNDTAAIAANRSAGAAAFTMAAGTTINTATNNGNITITMGTGPGAGTASGNITLANLNAGGGSVVITNNGVTSGSGIVAASGSDVITANAASFTVGTGNISLATNVAQLTVNDAGGNVTLSNAAALDIGTSVVTGNLSLTTAGALVDSGAVTVSGTTTLAAGANNIVLDQAGNNFNTVTLTSVASATLVDANAIDLGAVTASGNLNVTATAGNITNSGALAIGGNTSFTANQAGASISVNNAANNFGGTVSFAGNGGLANVSVADTTALDLSALTLTNNLNVTAAGITQSGNLVVGGTATLAAGANNITLSQAGNNFGTVSVTSANNAVLRDTNAIDLGASTLTGALTVTTAGAITDSGALAVSGATTLAAGAGNNITLDNADNFASVGITSANNVALNDINALVIATSTISGNLNVTTAGALTQSGALTVAGTSSFSVGANVITLTNASNDFTGAVALANSGANNVAITDTNAIQLGTSSVGSGTLTVNAVGITQTGPITQAAGAGIATFNAGAGVLTLANTSNDFTGAVALNTTSNAAVTDTNALDLGASNVTGNLNVTTGGALTDSGAVSVAGVTTLAAGASNNITLDNADDFNTIAIVSGNNVVLNDVNTINLGASTVAGNLNVTTSGALTQSGALMVAGTSSFNVGANAITLTNTSNDFTGAVALTNSGANNVAISDTNAIQLGTSSLGSGTLTVNAVGITQTGAITQAASAGAATFNAGGGALTLTNASNDFTGAVSLSTTGNAAITDVNALNLGASNVTGNLNVTTGGALTDSGAVSVAGVTTLTAGVGNNITLDNADDFATVSLVSGNNVTLNDINALSLGAATVAGNMNVTTGGALSQSGALTVTGTSNFNAGANAITLTNASNDFSGAVSLTNSGANAVAITDVNAIQLGTVSVGSGALTVNAVGITQTGPITQAASAGTATFNAGTGALTLTNASNDFTGAVTLNTTNSAAITDLNALNLGTSTISGNLNVVTNGAITDSGALTIAGATTLTAGTGNNITLDNADDFGTVGVISGNNVTLNDINALLLAASTISGNLNVTTSGALTQSGALTIAGTSNFNTGAGAITLTNTSNDFVGATVLTTTNSAAITDANALNLGAATVSGNLNVTTGGAMTDSGVLTVAGTTTLAAGAGNNITLDNANDFGTVAIVSGNNTVLNDINSLNLGASTVSGNLSVTAGPLTQSGALTVAGTSSFDAGVNAITLTNASNDFTGAVSLTNSGAHNVALTDTNGIQLGAASLGSGTLTINAVGITQSGPIVQAASAGAATFNSGAGALTLTNASNDFTGAVTLNTTNSAAITDLNALNLGTSSISGNLNAVASGAITDSGALTIAGATTLTAGAGNNITLDNADDFATISIVSGNNVTLNDINALTLGTSTVSGALNITTSGALTNSGALTIAGNTTLASGTTRDISLNNAANNFSGTVTVISGNNVTLVDANTLTLGGIEATGALNVAATAGDITAGGALNVGGTAAFTANQAGASINITNAGNHLLGAVSLSGTGGLTNASVSNTTALDLQALTLSGNLTVTAAGINQGGAWVVGGTTTLAVGANDIVLGHSGNNFNTVSIVSAHDVAITDSNALDLGAATITGDMSITTNGAITDSGALSVAGITTLAAGSGNNITLDNANDFATISIDSGNNVTLNDSNALNFGTSSIAGNLNVTTNGALMQSGALTVAGTSNIHAGANAITLANAANDFTGAVSLNNSGTNNVTIADANALQLGTSSLGSGTLTVNAVGITQTGPIIQASGAGAATFNSGAGAIALTNVGNDFSGAVSLSSGSNVSITVSDGLNLGPSTVGGNLNALVAMGDITNSGALIIGGDTSLTANQAGASIHVNNAANQFGGSVVFAGAGGLANVGITDTTALDLSALHLSGNLDVTASSISESGDLVVAGATTLNTGTGGITLDRVGNDFNSVSVISAHDVVLNDSNAIVFGGAAIAGNLSVTANGSITDSGALVVAGATTLAAGSGNNITLDNADDFASVAIVSGNNVALTDVNALTLGTANVSGDLTITAGGNVTGSASLNVAGATTIAAGIHDVIVDNAANALTGPIAVTGHDVVLVNALATDLGAIHASGNLQVTAGGTITDSTALTVAGTTDISTGASGATITLDNASTYGGAVSLSTHLANISLSNVVGDLSLGTITGDVVTLSATHSILNGIGAGSNIDAATDATLIATTGTIGLADNAIRVSVPTVSVSAGGTAQDFSVNLEGQVADKTIHLLDTPEGLVVLNGTLIGAAISPTDPVVSGVNPASGQGAVVNAVTSLNNANGSSDRALPASTAGSLQGLVYPTGHARTEMTYGCGEIRQIDSLVVNIDFAMKLPSGVLPMLEQQDRLLRDTDRGQKNTCRYRGT